MLYTNSLQEHSFANKMNKIHTLETSDMRLPQITAGKLSQDVSIKDLLQQQKLTEKIRLLSFGMYQPAFIYKL
ncbi:unnamed protein product [Paramecium sonneborni]|uniref:Uncharacterized protein n=1 Tax=Paramecium sonneborni TaxID=65129 RepID=A0A8S1LXQ0_9CILI|nr:unnamed protein product [Paramecium sonneborni]